MILSPCSATAVARRDLGGARRQADRDVGDVADYHALAGVIARFQPDAVVRYAEQRAAPYSSTELDEGLAATREWFRTPHGLASGLDPNERLG